jgi:hypothetical protein
MASTESGLQRPFQSDFLLAIHIIAALQESPYLIEPSRVRSGA